MLDSAFAVLPITYCGLVVERTTRCNAKCAMCYQAAGPKGSEILGKASLSRDLIARVLREARDIPSLGSRFHLSGGEGFLQVEDCLFLLRVARTVGYREISTTTNAFWAREPAEALMMLQRLAEAGLTRMEISWDEWHLPYVTAVAVNHAIEACAKFGIEACLRLLATKRHSVGAALRLLSPAALAAMSWGAAGPVFPTGRAAKKLDIADIHFPPAGPSTCHAVLNLTVNAKGHVAPCCAGYDQTETMVLGNVHDESIVVIAERMNRSLFLRALLFQGPAAFLPILQRAGCAPVGPHAGICHLCWDIFSDPQRAAAVAAHFDAVELDGVRRALHLLKAPTSRSSEVTDARAALAS